VGTAMAVKLYQKGYRVVAVYSRSLSSSQRLAEAVGAGVHVYNDAQAVADNSEIVFITTPDGVISTIASETKWHKGQGVVPLQRRGLNRGT